MPNIKSAKKRVKIIEKKTLRNNMIKSEYKTAVKRFEEALNNNNNFLNAEAKLPRNMEENRKELLQALNKKTTENENLVKQTTIHNGFVDPSKRDPKDPSTWGKVMRNELCPCGSGKKYKKCCGRKEISFL